MSEWQLAQLNVATLVAPEGDEQVQEFFDELDRINAIADKSPGFVWRLQSDDGNATDIHTTIDPRLLVNMSVWDSADELFDFVYQSSHTPVMARRREWFERWKGAYQVLWWVPRGHEPSVDEAFAKLWHLDRFGPTPIAFTFKSQFPQPGVKGSPTDWVPDPWCAGRG